jgi:hypothetical protein
MTVSKTLLACAGVFLLTSAALIYTNESHAYVASVVVHDVLRLN